MLHGPADVTREWLEAALGRRVHAFERIDAISTWGAHVRIVAEVEGEAAPLKLRVKLGSATVFGRTEVDYYLNTFAGLANAPLVHCHHAEADDTHYCLLLDDLTDSHCNQDDVPVTRAYGRSLVESLAQLHSHRWALPPPDAAGIEASLRPAQAGLPVMLGAMQEGFSAAEIDTVQHWRLCVTQMLMVPASRCAEPGAVTEMRWLWQMHLRRALAALADMGE
jgi:hypothetical protein